MDKGMEIKKQVANLFSTDDLGVQLTGTCRENKAAAGFHLACNRAILK
jgi:hypothetical protein